MGNMLKRFHICACGFRKIFANPRLYLSFLWFFLSIGYYMAKVKSFSAMMGVKASPWIFLLLIPDAMGQLFIIIGATLLFCDAPFMNETTIWQLVRAGRKNWFWGNMLYIWLLSLFYAVMLFLLPNFLLFPDVSWTSGWGQILGALAQSSAASTLGINSLNYSVMVQYTPLQAAGCVLLAVWLNPVLVGMINYVCNLWLKRGTGPLFSIVMGLSPYLIVRLADFRIGYYLSPPAWMNISMYNWDGYGDFPSPTYIYTTLAVLLLILMVLGYIGIRRKDIDPVSGI